MLGESLLCLSVLPSPYEPPILQGCFPGVPNAHFRIDNRKVPHSAHGDQAAGKTVHHVRFHERWRVGVRSNVW